MNATRELLADAAAAGLLLTRSGEKLHIESMFGAVPPDDLQHRLRQDRDELLAWLDWCETADDLLLEMTERIAARYPTGCPVDDLQWQAADEALHIAYHSQNLETLREAFAERERFAFAKFAEHLGT
jgi:hypothetical protein